MGSEFSDFAVARYAPLLRFALAVSGDRGQAEDLVHTALVRTAMRWSSVRRKDDPEAFVRTVIVREHINLWRRLRSRERIIGVHAEAASLDPSLAAVEDRDRLWTALMSLPARQRAIVVLRHLYDQSEQQTAEQMRCSVGTVKSQCSRGLQRLRATLSGDATGADREHTDAQ